MKQDNNTIELIAPCGMNCGLCGSYLVYTHEIPKRRGKISYCSGCRPRNKECSFVKKRCDIIKNNDLDFCFLCKEFPCENLKRIVKGYKKYNYNIIDNLTFIKDNGLESFIVKEKNHYMCPQCGDTICIYNKKCYTCDRHEII